MSASQSNQIGSGSGSRRSNRSFHLTPSQRSVEETERNEVEGGSSGQHSHGRTSASLGGSNTHSYDMPGDFYPNMIDDANQSPDGTFGRHASRNGSIHSKSNESLPSPFLSERRLSAQNRRSVDSATPIAGLNIISTSTLSKGKQKAKDDNHFITRSSIDSSRKSSIRWSGELPRLDEVNIDDHQGKFRTPLSPRLQAISAPIATAKTSNPSLTQIPNSSYDAAIDSNLTPDIGGSNRSTNYRRFERELESRRRILEEERMEGLSQVSSDRTPTPTSRQALDGGKITDTANNAAIAQAKRGKHVSLGQVSVDGVPITIGSPIYSNALNSSSVSPTRHLRTDSRNSSKPAPRRYRSNSNSAIANDQQFIPGSRSQSSSRVRRLALSDSSRSAQSARRLRKRTSSDPIVKNGDVRSDGMTRRSEDSRAMFGIFEGGRARRLTGPGAVDGNLAISQITLAPSLVQSQTKSEQNLTADRMESGVLPGFVPSRNSSNIMRWDPAHATTISLRQIDPYDGRHGLYAHNRISTTSTVMMQNRNLAKYHLEILSSLRSRIPRHPSESLKSLQFGSTIARIHHILIIFQNYLHVLATIFFDYNGLYTLIQIALYPDARDDQSTAWWIAIGIYAASLLIWFIFVLIIWEFFVQYKRRWISDRPFALPLYLSSSGFNLSCVRSFSIYSLFYRTRLQASKQDFIIESFWYLSQNWPTVSTLLPRGIILTIMLVIYHPSSSGLADTRRPINGQMRDPVYFSEDDGLLTNFSYVILLVYVSWIAWRMLVLLISWMGLFFTLGPTFLFKREGAMYEDEEHDISMTDFRLSTSSRPLLRHHIDASALTKHGEQVGKKNSEMQQLSVPRRSVGERRSTNTTRPDLGSLEIPRRSHSLVAHSKENVNRSNRDLAENGEARSGGGGMHLPLTRSSNQHLDTDLPTWAWRARAEERLSSLLLDCQVIGGMNLTSEEVDESTDFHNNTNHLPLRHEQHEHDRGGRQLSEDVAHNPVTIASPAIDVQDWTDGAVGEGVRQPQNTVRNLPTRTDPHSAVFDAKSGERIGPGLSLPFSMNSVSTVDVGESVDVGYPFPRKSEEMMLQANILSHSSLINPTSSPFSVQPTTTPIQYPTLSPLNQIQQEQQETLNTDIKNHPYNSASNVERSSKRSLTSKKHGSSNSGSNSASSLVESVRTALGRKSVEVVNLMDTNRSRTTSVEVSKSQEQQQKLQTEEQAMSAATAESGTTSAWWRSLFPGSGTVEKNIDDVDKNEDQDVVKTDQVKVYPRASSPLSGMRTSKLHRSASEEDNSGEMARKSVATEDSQGVAISKDTGDNDSSSLHSVSTDDSEERRIWSQFPEQSRRHPPGLIALELEQRTLSEKRKRDQRISSSSSNSGSSGENREGLNGTAKLTSSTTPTNNETTPSADSSFEGDSSFGSGVHLLTSSQLEILGPIQEESWSNSHETGGTDEEIELMQSEQHFVLRR